MGFLDRIKKAFVGDDESAEAAGATDQADGTAPRAQGGDIEQALRAVIAEQSDGELSAEQIPADALLLDDGILDSLSSVKVLTFIEEKYGVQIEEAELAGRLDTLAALVEHVAAESARGKTV